MLPVMRSASKLNGIVFILMLIGMCIYSLPAVFSFARSQPPGAGVFVDGKLLRQFENFYDKNIFLRDFSIQQWANLQYLLFHEGASGAVFGRDGWLFSNQEYLIPNDLSINIDNQLAQVDQVRNTLGKAGKKLIVLPVPMKLDIQRSYAVDTPDSRLLNLHDEFVTRLVDQKITVSSVRQAFLSATDAHDIFIRNDTHWSPEGARLAAKELARQHPELISNRHYITNVAEKKAITGDLVNFLKFDPRFNPLYFTPVNIELYETVDQGQKNDADALFADVSYTLALVGTSYSRIDDWHFVGFLKEALQNDLLSIAVEAKGPFQAMDEFLSSSSFRDPAVTTVIWEFPVRTLLAQRTNLRSGGQQNTTQF